MLSKVVAAVFDKDVSRESVAIYISIMEIGQIANVAISYANYRALSYSSLEAFFWALSLVSRSISGEELLFFGFLRYKVVSVRIE